MIDKSQYLCLLLSLTTLGACQSKQPIKAWQQRLTDYTMKEGHGDLNVLRESAELRSPDSPRPAQIRFDQTDLAKAGLPRFTDRMDVYGIMVGQSAEDGNPVFYFLVGVVTRPASGRPAELDDVRLVSCSVRDGQHFWKTSDPDRSDLERYLSSSSGAQAATTRLPDTFPRLDDDFRLEVQGGVARATEMRSGATWELPLH